MKEIQLTQGKVAIIDDEDLEKVYQYKWCACKGGKTFYAQRNIKINGKYTMVSMHRFIMDYPIGLQVDHINHNGLDNRKENLRVCNAAQNQWNQKSRTDNASGFRGVSLFGKKWRAHIRISSKKIYLGSFNAKEEAAFAYDKKAVELFGEFACLNFP